MKVLQLIIVFGLVAFSIPEIQAQKKVFVAISGLNDLQQEFIKEQDNAELAFMIYESELSEKGSMHLDTILLKKSIAKKIPNTVQTGIGILDWESPFKILKSGNVNRQFVEIEKEFLLALKIAKRERPNIKWAFYGLPFRSFRDVSSRWRLNNERLRNILDASDFLAPSLYMYSGRLYDKPGPYLERGASDRIADNLMFFLQLAKSLDKDIYPFIWHRSYLNLIPAYRFTNYIQLINSTKYLDKSITGLIWWDHQSYYYAIRESRVNLKKEYMNVDDVDNYHLEVFKKYFHAIDNLIRLSH